MRFKYRSKRFDIEGVSRDDHIYRKMARYGTFYEIDLLEYVHRLKPLINSEECKNVAVDVGANIGNHSIFLRSFMVDHLIAIEPNPVVLAHLRRNLSKNVDGYTLCDSALGEKESKGSMVVPENMPNNVGAARVDLRSSDGDIAVTTLDAVFSSWLEKENDPVSLALIKIDVEGMEIQVLKGAEDTINTYKPHIFAESATKQQLQEIRAHLKAMGYGKLPGHWASTPVHHFAYKPSLRLLLTAYYMQLRKLLRKLRPSPRKL